MNEIIVKILQVLEEVRPMLQNDGGDVELLNYEDGVVTVRLVGACGSCAISTMTLKQGIETRMMEAIPEVKEVVAL